MIKAVLIDIDDTILDFQAYVKESIKNGFERFNLGAFDESVYETFKKVNTKLWKEVEDGVITYEDLLKNRWKTVFEELNVNFDGQVFEKYFKKLLFDSGIVVEGAKELLDYLKEKYVLCIASNGPYEQQINRLKVGGLYDYFDYFVISEGIGLSKPHKEFFEYALNKINEKQFVLPSEVIMIGDSLTADMVGGKNAGIKTCLFNVKGLDYSTFSPDYVVDKLEEVKRFL